MHSISIVDRGEVGPRADVQVEAGAREELHRRVLERAFGDAEFEFHMKALTRLKRYHRGHGDEQTRDFPDPVLRLSFRKKHVRSPVWHTLPSPS